MSIGLISSAAETNNKKHGPKDAVEYCDLLQHDHIPASGFLSFFKPRSWDGIWEGCPKHSASRIACTSLSSQQPFKASPSPTHSFFWSDGHLCNFFERMKCLFRIKMTSQGNSETGACPRLCKCYCALKSCKYNYTIEPCGLYWWADTSVVQLTHCKHRVPHCQMTLARPHLGPKSTHGLTVAAQCSSAMWLQYQTWHSLKQPRSSLVHVLWQLCAAKPSWAEGCPAGWPSKQCKWSEMHGRHLSRHFVCLSLCHCLLPKELSQINILSMYKHYLMCFWCKSHDKALRASSILVTTVSTSTTASRTTWHSCPFTCIFRVRFGPVRTMETSWVCLRFDLVLSNNLHSGSLPKADVG